MYSGAPWCSAERNFYKATIKGTSGVPRHTKLTRYRCSLPGLAGFAGNRCTEPEVPSIGSRAKNFPRDCEAKFSTALHTAKATAPEVLDVEVEKCPQETMPRRRIGDGNRLAGRALLNFPVVPLRWPPKIELR